MQWPEDSLEVIEHCHGLYGELQLQKRGEDFEIIYNGVFLMATYNGASEKTSIREALKQVTCREKGPIRVLLGGLGVGYSLQEALSLKEVERVVVAEIEPAIIKWNHRFFTRVNGNALEDHRTKLVQSDFKKVLEEEVQLASERVSLRYHVIMVDTDNGSSWLSLPSNSFFYHLSGLSLIERCLHQGGVASFWCAKREKDFEERLNRVFQQVEFGRVPERTGHDGCYYLAYKDH